ncbi:MAG: hypothetical protein QM817_36080 [Archangium sp.]
MNLTLAAVFAAVVSSPGFVLHEWGTFTSVAGDDGKPIEWRPLASKSDLPSFVYDVKRLGSGGLRAQFIGKGDMSGNVRMETPVIYFYTSAEMDVSLKVSFTGGAITEWYPWARQYSGNLVDWGKFKLVPNSIAKLPQESAPSHYYPARNVDAVQVRVCGTNDSSEQQFEKFLFYRGVGTFALPVGAKLNGDEVKLSGMTGEALLFESRGGKVGVTRVSSNGKVRRPNLDRKVDDAHALVLELLISAGLYEKEAKAMLETWRDTWFEDGLRVIYLVPRATTDSLLPLEVKPAPTSSVRVLVGRFELLTKEQVVAAKEKLFKTKDLATLGRFAEPLAKQIRLLANEQEKKFIDEKLAAWGGQGATAVVQ